MSKSVLNTTLEFGLVSVAVRVMPTKSEQDVKLDRATPVYEGEKIVGYHGINQVELDAVTKLARGEDVIYGVFESKPDKDDRATWTDFKPISPDALQAIKDEGKVDAFRIEGFLDAEDVPMERVQGCYFLAPERGSGKQLRLLHDALKQTGKFGLIRIAIRDKQRPAVVYAKDGAIYLNTLAWAEDCQAFASAAETIQVAEEPPAKMVAMAVTLIESLPAAREDLDAMADELRPKKLALLEAALAGKAVTVTTAKGAPVEDGGDLMARLEASVKAAPKKKAVAKKKVAA